MALLSNIGSPSGVEARISDIMLLFGYANEEGMVKAADFQRYTYTLGFDADINKWIKSECKILRYYF